MNTLAYYHYAGGGDIVHFFVFILIVVCFAALALYAIRTWITDAFLNKFLTFVVVVVAVLAVLLSFVGCSAVPIKGASPVTTTGQDLNTVAAQATQAWVDYKSGNINWAWAVSQGLYAYETIIKTEADFKAIATAWSGNGTFADKLARIFAASTAPPEVKTATIAKAVQSVAMSSSKP